MAHVQSKLFIPLSDALHILLLIHPCINTDIVNIGLHFFLKDVRPMLPPVMNRSIVDA